LPNGSSDSVKGLSCPSTSLCVAADFAGTMTISTDPTGGASAWTVTPVNATDGLFGVSCPSTGLCVAIDGSGDVLTSTDPTGGSSAWTTAKVDGINHLNSVSCTSSLCVAVDDSGDVVTSSNPTGGSSAWTVTRLPGVAELLSVSCASSSFCAAVGVFGTAVTSNDPTGGESAWTVNTIGTAENNLSGVSCVSEVFCLAVDQEGNVMVGAPSSETPAPKEEEKHTGGSGTTGGSGSSTGSTASTGSSGSTSSGSGTTATISSAQIAALLGQQLVPSGKAATIGALLKDGGLTMSFKALEAGTLVVGWYEVPAGAKLTKHSKAKAVLVASGQMTFTGAGTEKIKVKLTAAGRRLLKHTKQVRLEVKGVFTLSGKAPVSTTTGFVLKR
jgi:hypothetical protein